MGRLIGELRGAECDGNTDSASLAERDIDWLYSRPPSTNPIIIAIPMLCSRRKGATIHSTEGPTNVKNVF